MTEIRNIKISDLLYGFATRNFIHQNLVDNKCVSCYNNTIKDKSKKLGT